MILYFLVHRVPCFQMHIHKHRKKHVKKAENKIDFFWGEFHVKTTGFYNKLKSLIIRYYFLIIKVTLIPVDFICQFN